MPDFVTGGLVKWLKETYRPGAERIRIVSCQENVQLEEHSAEKKNDLPYKIYNLFIIYIFYVSRDSLGPPPW